MRTQLFDRCTHRVEIQILVSGEHDNLGDGVRIPSPQFEMAPARNCLRPLLAEVNGEVFGKQPPSLSQVAIHYRVVEHVSTYLFTMTAG